MLRNSSARMRSIFGTHRIAEGFYKLSGAIEEMKISSEDVDPTHRTGKCNMHASGSCMEKDGHIYANDSIFTCKTCFCVVCSPCLYAYAVTKIAGGDDVVCTHCRNKLPLVDYEIHDIMNDTSLSFSNKLVQIGIYMDVIKERFTFPPPNEHEAPEYNLEHEGTPEYDAYSARMSEYFEKGKRFSEVLTVWSILFEAADVAYGTQDPSERNQLLSAIFKTETRDYDYPMNCMRALVFCLRSHRTAEDASEREFTRLFWKRNERFNTIEDLWEDTRKLWDILVDGGCFGPVPETSPPGEESLLRCIENAKNIDWMEDIGIDILHLEERVKSNRIEFVRKHFEPAYKEIFDKTDDSESLPEDDNDTPPAAVPPPQAQAAAAADNTRPGRFTPSERAAVFDLLRRFPFEPEGTILGRRIGRRRRVRESLRREGVPAELSRRTVNTIISYIQRNHEWQPDIF